MPPATDRNGKGGGLARDKMTSVFQQKIKKKNPVFHGPDEGKRQRTFRTSGKGVRKGTLNK